MARLKVFRTAIGFHDAYVATPTKKAALEAWGAAKNLFARGDAEEVTDPALAAEPLARPGQVIKRLRGTAAEQLAALPPDPPRASAPAKAVGGRPKAAAKPHPSRAALDAAEAALSATERQADEKLRAIAEEEARLAERRRRLEQDRRRTVAALERDRAREAERYDAAIRRWEA